MLNASNFCHYPTLFLLLIFSLPTTAHTQIEYKVRSVNSFRITRISGIWYTEEHNVLLLGDRRNSGYFTGVLDDSTHHLRIDGFREIVSEIRSPDFESVGQLGDGRVVGLSESEAALIAATDVHVAKIEIDEYKADGGRGLEGMAISANRQSSIIALLWEGGFHKESWIYASPSLVVDTIYARQSNKIIQSDPISLDLESSHQWLARQMGTREGEHYKLRATDLVWFGNGFIILMPSLRKPQKDRYGPAIMQPFSYDGKPLADPVLLDSLLPTELATRSQREGYNWEALCKVGKDKLLVANDHAQLVAIAEIKIPRAWLKL